VKKTKPKARADKRNISAVKVPVCRKKTSTVTGAGRLAQAGEMTLLEENSISAMVETQYSEYLRAFKAFYKENGWGELLDKNTDLVLADFFDVKYLEGRGSAEGEKTIAAIQFHDSRFKSGEMLLVRSKRALKGWRKLVPQGSRLPMPKLICQGIAMMMLARGQRGMAIMTLADFDMYLRPSEGLELTGKCVVAPVRGAGIAFQFFAVIIRDLEDGRPDKVGVYDNTLLLNNPRSSFLGPVLKALATKAGPSGRLFTFSMEEYRKELEQCSKLMGLKDVLHPYQLRHGGATEDMNSGARTRLEVKDRGRWATETSIKRYVKVGKLQILLNSLDANMMRFCRWSETSMPKVLHGIVAAKLP
jgi:hypothetical protein